MPRSEQTTKTPRPYTKTEQVLTTVTPAVRERLDAYAVEHEMSRAEAVRRFILKGLAAADDTP